MYQSTKTFGHELGMSCAFRQWKADSHCKFVHGYALSFKFVFGCKELDGKNWVMDFGSLKKLKEILQDYFDHKLVIAANDPLISHFRELDGVAWDLTVLDQVGCESFASHAFNCAQEIVASITNNRVFVVSCECSEHGANSSIYFGDNK